MTEAGISTAFLTDPTPPSSTFDLRNGRLNHIFWKHFPAMSFSTWTSSSIVEVTRNCPHLPPLLANYQQKLMLQSVSSRCTISRLVRTLPCFHARARYTSAESTVKRMLNSVSVRLYRHMQQLLCLLPTCCEEFIFHPSAMLERGFVPGSVAATLLSQIAFDEERSSADLSQVRPSSPAQKTHMRGP